MHINKKLMGNLQFILSLTDMFSTPLRAAASVSNSAGAQIAQQMNNITHSSAATAAGVGQLRTSLEAVNSTRPNHSIANEFNNATTAAHRLENQITRVQSAGVGLGGILGGLGAGLGIGMIGKEAFTQSATAESQKVAFKVMTGSKGEGDKLYNNVVSMADRTPFESQDLARSSKTMLGYGVDKKEIMPDLGMIGDIAAGMDYPAESLQRLSLAFGQVTAKGHLAGQEAMQMIDAGFNPLKEISDATGMSMNNLLKAQEHGAITTNMVKLAFQHATGEGGKFHNMMKEQSEMLGGRWSTFMDGVHHKLRDLGDFLKPVFIGLMDFGTGLLNAEPGALAMATAIGAISFALTAQSIATKVATVTQWALNVAMEANPIGLIVAGIAALVAGVIYCYNHFETFRGIIWGAWEGIKAFGTMIKDFVIDSIVAMTKGITGIGETLYLFFTGEWKKSWEAGKSAVHNLMGGDAFNHAMENGRKIGHAAVKGYKAGVADLVKERAEKVAGQTVLVDNGKTNYEKEYEELLKKYNDGNGVGKDRADSINSGGQRSIVINIGKQIEKMEVHLVGGGKEVAAEIETAIRESLRRVLYSLNGAVS